MNWYKKASSNYATWLTEAIRNNTNNFTTPSCCDDKVLDYIEQWFKETNPDTEDLSLYDAARMAISHVNDKQPQNSPEQIRRNMNKFFAESQSVNPDAPDFAVDPRGKSKSIPSNIRKRINNAIHDLGNYHVQIPLQNIFDICKQNGVVALQEDGTPWQGLLAGGAECGTEKARNQNAKFDLAVRVEGNYVPADNLIVLNWCKMPSGKYEVVCYVS